MVNEKGELEEVIKYWIEKPGESLSAARDELKAEPLSFSVNRIYYACFYVVSALLLNHRIKFRKHSGVRAEFHKNFVKEGLINREFGQFYDEIYLKLVKGVIILSLSVLKRNRLKNGLKKRKNL